MKIQRQRLADVADPQGRVDVVLYRVLSHWADRIEQDHGVRGLREHILPILEEAICDYVPSDNLIPREIAAVLKLYEANRRRLE